MNMRQLSASDLAQIREVWKECFNDSDAFLDTYFETVVAASNGLGFFDGSRLVSDMFVTLMNAQISGMVYEAGFLSGCATLPKARNRNLMRELIRAALEDMRSRRVCVSFLQPFMHSFYRRFGYETVNYVQRHTVQSNTNNTTVHKVSSIGELPESALYASYQAYVSQYGSYFIRSKDRMHGWLQLLLDDSGYAVYIEGEDNTPYALFYESIDASGELVADIFELVYFNSDQLELLTTGTGCTASYMLPCTPQSTCAEEYTMMRVVCPEIVLESYRYGVGTEPFVININDPFMGLDYNLEVTPHQKGASVRQVETASDIVVEISDLARLLTGTYSAAQYPEAERVFRQNSSCYFDTY